MFDELNQAIDGYMGKWQALVNARKNKEFFERLKPTAAGWKVADFEEYERLKREWRSAIDLLFENEMNGRWIAEIPALPGVLAYGDTRDEAIERAYALALEALETEAIAEHRRGATRPLVPDTL